MTNPPQPIDEALRKKILNLLHRTEGDKEFLDKHLNPPNQCDMDLAAPRCAKRVKELEKLFNERTTQAVTAALKRADAALPKNKPYGKDTPDEYTEQWHDGFNSAVGIAHQSIANELSKLEEAE